MSPEFRGDSPPGKPDFLFLEADDESVAGAIREWLLLGTRSLLASRYSGFGFQELPPLERSPDRFTVRIGGHDRALGRITAGKVTWVWIGSHAGHDRLVW
jgi:hypothetical protein